MSEPALTREQVAKTATLARLSLTEAEIDAAAIDLEKILYYVGMLAEVETDGVEPMTHAVEFVSVFVDDAVGAELPRAQALANAPKQDGECYLVPAVLD